VTKFLAQLAISVGHSWFGLLKSMLMLQINKYKYCTNAEMPYRVM